MWRCLVLLGSILVIFGGVLVPLGGILVVFGGVLVPFEDILVVFGGVLVPFDGILKVFGCVWLCPVSSECMATLLSLKSFNDAVYILYIPQNMVHRKE